MRGYFRRDTMPTVTRYSYPINKFMGFDATGNDDAIPFSYASYGYNISFQNGVLKKGLGISLAHTEEFYPTIWASTSYIVKVHLYYHYDYENKIRDDRLIAQSSRGDVFQLKITGQGWVNTGMHFSDGKATFLNYHYNEKDCLLAIGTDGMYIYDGDNLETVPHALPLTHATVHYERVYGTMNDGNNRVYFSAPMAPGNWNVSLTEGGYLSFPDEGGKVQRVVSFNDGLYVFREYAIHKMTAYYDQTEFSLTKVYSGNSLIYPDTIAVCGNKILFLAEDGIHSFDGYNVKKMLRGLNNLIVKKNSATAAYFNGSYYLALGIAKDENVLGRESRYEVNNGIIAVDLDTGNVQIARGMDVAQFLPVNFGLHNKLLTIHHDFDSRTLGMVTDDGKLFGEVLKKYWQSPYSNIEKINSDKVLKRIYVAGKGLVTLSATLDNVHEYVMKLNGTKSAVINQRADRMGIAIESDDEDFEVTGLILEFDLIRRKEHE